MRLTAFTDYGLRMLMRMASAPERAFSTAELAHEFRLSRNHLAKIMLRLGRAGLIKTRRGGGGGAILPTRLKPSVSERWSGCSKKASRWLSALAPTAETAPLTDVAA